MKYNICVILFLIFFQTKKEHISTVNSQNAEQADNSINNRDGLYILKVNIKEDFVTIIPPKNSNFELPDSTAKIEPFKNGDFNADFKEDILVYLGACGTGGCMYGLFLKQYDNYYKLAYYDYLKNAEFKIEKDGLWTIESSEELEPYNPSKIQITTFKFDKNTYQYKLDTTYVHYDNETTH